MTSKESVKSKEKSKGDKSGGLLAFEPMMQTPKMSSSKHDAAMLIQQNTSEVS
jgi:hypothetical protein